MRHEQRNLSETRMSSLTTSSFLRLISFRIRAAVSNLDGPTMPVHTARVWILGIVRTSSLLILLESRYKREDGTRGRAETSDLS